MNYEFMNDIIFSTEYLQSNKYRVIVIQINQTCSLAFVVN